MINKVIFLLGASCLIGTGCSAIDLSDKPMEGYQFVVEKPYTGSGGGSFKYYIAPESKHEEVVLSKGSVTQQVESIRFTVVSVAKAYPHGGVKYYVEGYGCNQAPGTVISKRNTSSQDWDPRFQITPYGTPAWHIWNAVCK